jgi:hypothetical protein
VRHGSEREEQILTQIAFGVPLDRGHAAKLLARV